MQPGRSTHPRARGLCLAGVVALVFASCSGFGDQERILETPTWDGQIQSLLEHRCIECHTTPPRNDAPDHFRLDKYRRSDPPDDLLGAYDVRARILALAVNNRPLVMPPAGALPRRERALLEAWIDGGAPRDSAGIARSTERILAPGRGGSR